MTIMLILAVIVAGATLYLVWTINQRLSRSRDETGLTLLQDQVASLRRETADALTGNAKTYDQRIADLTYQMNQRLQAMDHTMHDTTGQVNTRLDNAVKVIREVSATMGELSKASQQIYDIGKDISSLQQILRAPKLRGVIGELFLGDLLRQVVPNNYEIQHRFRSGEIVDAVVKLGPRLVPIDAKFPLENFQKLNAATEAERKALRKRFITDVEKHIDAISRKYILPDEDTYDFALMYIPAENVYYECIIREEADDESVSAYAISKRVIPVSPNSMYAYLQAIVFGLRGLRIEKQAQEIMDHFGRLQQEFGKFRDDFDVVGSHLVNAHNKYDSATKHLTRLEEKLALTVEPAPRVAPPEQSRPEAS
jgi:DNA recombination protein RmuC